MDVLTICVLVHATTEQFPNKSIFIKTVSVSSNNLQSMFFYSAQEGMSFLDYSYNFQIRPTPAKD